MQNRNKKILMNENIIWYGHVGGRNDRENWSSTVWYPTLIKTIN